MTGWQILYFLFWLRSLMLFTSHLWEGCYACLFLPGKDINSVHIQGILSEFALSVWILLEM